MTTSETLSGPTRTAGGSATGDDTRAALVTQRTRAADRVVTLQLASSDGEAFPEWTPGAHIDVVLPDGTERQYSLCGTEPGTWAISVLDAPEGRGGSAWIHANVHEGDLLRIRGPRNKFALVEAERYVFIAGGIGITPIAAMVRSLEQAGRTEWRLTYGGRTRAGMAFFGELEALGERVSIQPQDEAGLIDLEAALGSPAIGTAVYCCGPEPLLKAVERACRSWPPGSLHVERFSAPAAPAAGTDRSFEVVAARSGITATVSPGESILLALERQGVFISTSCGEGVCGTCETRVIEGEIEHRDAVLSETERLAGEVMMPCCSRAKGDRLVLDI